MSAGSAASHWADTRERSNRAALRTMAWVATRLGRRFARVLLHPITLYFLAFAPAARRRSARFLERALGRRPRWGERYRHFHTFASAVLDRIYFVRGEFGAFDLAVEGHALVEATLAEGRGAFLLGAHVGSFEALHAVGAAGSGRRVAMVMYPDNARLVQGVLEAVAPGSGLAIIAIGRSTSTLAIRDWLADGGLVGLLGDRFLAGDAGIVELPFLGRAAPFPDGPLRLAMLLRQRVVFMVGLFRGGRRYEVRFESLADFRQPPADAAGRDQAVRAALVAYVARLEALAREAPDNWFNFHDFWNEEG